MAGGGQGPERLAVVFAGAAVGLAGSLAIALSLHKSASQAFENLLTERLMGAGQSAARLFQKTPADAPTLRDLMTVNQLDGAYVLGPGLEILADAAGQTGRVDLLRVDPARVKHALEGQPSVGQGYSLGEAEVLTGYFPIEKGRSILALEAGESFVAGRQELRRARDLAILLSFVTASALFFLALRWAAAEKLRRVAAERAARGAIMSQMAATAAHELRNPLAVISGTVELMRERMGPSLKERDREAIADVLGEVERLRRLSEDFLDLSADRPIASEPVDLAALIETAVRAAEASHPEVRIQCSLPWEQRREVRGDAARLRQVLANLLSNACEASPRGSIDVALAAEGEWAVITVHDDGPGVPASVREQIFEPFFTTRSAGTGLGLAASKRLLERHGGTIRLVRTEQPGATFEVRLPSARREA